jgi:hypothetical protein
MTTNNIVPSPLDDQSLLDSAVRLAPAMTALIIPFRVTFCNTYSDTRQPSYMEMVRTAWILTPHGTKRRPAGFVRGEDLTQKELDEVLSTDPDP